LQVTLRLQAALDHRCHIPQRVDIGETLQVDGDIVVILDIHHKFHHLYRLQPQVPGQMGLAFEPAGVFKVPGQ